MPNPQNLLAILAGGRRFSRIDLKQAYQQLGVASDSQHYLTINTNQDLFTFNRMPSNMFSAWNLAANYRQPLVRNSWCHLLFGQHISSWRK